jgi:type VI secretion system protein ImpA
MVDLERILAPLSGDAPCGRNLRLVPGDTTFASLDEMRREEDAALDPAGKGKTADWKGVVARAEAALAEKSKDLQLGAYLAQGLARTQGFEGLREGLHVLRMLLERYWECMHPGSEDGEIVPGVRAKWLSWVGSSGDFRNTVKRIPITSGTGTPRSWFDLEESRRVDQAALLADKTQLNELVQAGRITGDEWRTALDGTSPSHLDATVKALRGCSEELAQLVRLCEEKLGGDGPSLMPLSATLEECQEYLTRMLAGSGEDGAGDEETPTGQRGARSSGPITNREEAYQHLREVADYLRRTEPHSPVSYLIDRAVRWGRLPFQDLLKDVLKHNEDARTTVLETLGLAEPEE